MSVLALVCKVPQQSTGGGMGMKCCAYLLAMSAPGGPVNARIKCCACLLVLMMCASTSVRAGGEKALRELLLACRNGDYEAVQVSLRENREPLARQAIKVDRLEQSYTALYVAASGGYAGIVWLLLEAGADVNRRSGPGRTPLMQVCRHSQEKSTPLPFDLVKMLAPPQPSALGSTCSRPAFFSCARDRLHCLRLLVDSGADLDVTDQRGCCALYYCAEQGNRDALTLLIECGAKVRGWRSYKNDPLCRAASGGHIACVRVLLAAHCPIITDSRYGYSALGEAAKGGHVNILQDLLQQGVSANCESSPSGGSPLLIASLEGQLPCVQALLDAGAGINRPNCEGDTALFCAAYGGHLKVVELLLACGASVQGWRSYRNDPLYAAAFNGHIDCVQALTKAGCPVITNKKHGCSALNGASQNGHAKILNYFLQCGISANAESTPLGGTPLLVAAEKGQVACIQILLNAGADIDHFDSGDHTALYHAARKGHLTALEMLLSCGAKIRGWVFYKSDPLCVAAFNGHIDCVRALTNAGALIVTGRKYGYSAPNHAAQNGYTEILAHFLQKGISADVESSPSGGTPLLAAADKGQLACMQLLLNAGANIDRPNANGCTALYYAAQKGHLAAVTYLLERKASVNCRTKLAQTPLSVACQNGHKAVVSALLSAGASQEGIVGSETPLCMAVREGDVEIVDYLLAAADLQARGNKHPLSCEVDPSGYWYCSQEDEQHQSWRKRAL